MLRCARPRAPRALAARVRSSARPAGTVCGSMPRAKFIAGVDALLVVAPCATEVPGLQRILNEVSHACAARRERACAASVRVYIRPAAPAARVGMASAAR
eukprot:1709808-Prymnesium_polylepis.1